MKQTRKKRKWTQRLLKIVVSFAVIISAFLTVGFGGNIQSASAETEANTEIVEATPTESENTSLTNEETPANIETQTNDEANVNEETTTTSPEKIVPEIVTKGDTGARQSKVDLNTQSFQQVLPKKDDLSNKVLIDSFDLIDKNGVLLEKNKGNEFTGYTEDKYITYGGIYGMIIYFDVNNEATTFNAGDTISFEFPVMESVTETVTNSPFNTTIGEGENAIGTWSTTLFGEGTNKHGVVTITLNEKATPYSQLSSAWVRIPNIGAAFRSQPQQESVTSITIGNVTNQYRVHGRYPTIGYLADQRDIKYGASADSPFEINWMVCTGYDLINNLHTANGGPAIAGQPLTGQNIVIDTLVDSAGHKATSVSRIEMTTTLYAPLTLTNSAGNSNAVIYPSLTQFYTRTDSDSSTYATVDDYAASLPVNHYGVYTAADQTLSVVVNYGVMGNDTPTVMDAQPDYATNLANYAVGWMGFFQDSDYNGVVDAVKRIYGPNNAIGGHINKIDLSIIARYPDTIGSLNIGNTARTTLSGELSNNRTITPPDSGSSVVPYEIKVKKYDSVTGDPIAGAKFKLQKRNEQNEWEDSSGSLTGAIEKTSDENGIVDWRDVLPGYYRVVETQAPPGYAMGTVTPDAGGYICTGVIEVPNVDDRGHLLEVSNRRLTTSADLKVTKRVEGTGAPDEEYHFNLAALNNAPMPAQSMVTAKDGDTASFGAVTFDSVGVYNYTITETQGTTPGMTYDTVSHPVTVTVKKQENSENLVATVNYGVHDSLTITNSYIQPIYTPGTGTINGTKVLKEGSATGKDIAIKDEQFSFVLTPASGIDTTGYNISSRDAKVKADGTFKFDDITFTKAGTYNFTVKENSNSNDKSYQYDQTIYNVKFVVTEDTTNNTLVVTKTVNDQKDGNITFTNFHIPPTSVNGTINGTKVLKEGSATGKNIAIKDEQFSFVLTPASGIDTTGYKISSRDAKVKADGTFKFDDITFTKAGTYNFTVKENSNPNDQYYQYDQTSYNVQFVVTEDTTNNKLVATKTVNNQSDKNITFTNFHIPPTSANETIIGTKVLREGSASGEMLAIQKDQFSFALTPASGNDTTGYSIDSTSANVEADGTFEFSPITFTKVGTYSFIVTENNLKKNNYQYDQTSYTVKFVVTEDTTNNKLVATKTVDDQSDMNISFLNIHNPPTNPTNPTKPTNPTTPTEPTNPSQPSTPNKPTVTTNDNKEKVDTGDDTPTQFYFVSLVVSALGYFFIKKRRNEKE